MWLQSVWVWFAAVVAPVCESSAVSVGQLDGHAGVYWVCGVGCGVWGVGDVWFGCAVGAVGCAEWCVRCGLCGMVYEV